MSIPTSPSLNIAALITRIRGSFQTSFTNLVVGVLIEIQAWANTMSLQLGALSKQMATITTTGTVSFVVPTLIVNVDQTAHTLVFQVQYADGTIKTGSVNLV